MKKSPTGRASAPQVPTITRTDSAAILPGLSLRFDAKDSTIGRSVGHRTMFRRCLRKMSMHNLLNEAQLRRSRRFLANSRAVPLPIGQFGPYQRHS